MTFTLIEAGDATELAMSYDYEPKGGKLALLYGALLDRQMVKGSNGFIDNLEPTAKAHAAA